MNKKNIHPASLFVFSQICRRTIGIPNHQKGGGNLNNDLCCLLNNNNHGISNIYKTKTKNKGLCNTAIIRSSRSQYRRMQWCCQQSPSPEKTNEIRWDQMELMETEVTACALFCWTCWINERIRLKTCHIISNHIISYQKHHKDKIRYLMYSPSLPIRMSLWPRFATHHAS